MSTLTTLNNVQNSLFIPNLGPFYRRQPTYNLTPSATEPSVDEEAGIARRDQAHSDKEAVAEGEPQKPERPADLHRINTISSVLTGVSEGHNYAVLPHGVSLPGWTDEEKAALDEDRKSVV